MNSKINTAQIKSGDVYYRIANCEKIFLCMKINKNTIGLFDNNWKNDGLTFKHMNEISEPKFIVFCNQHLNHRFFVEYENKLEMPIKIT